MSSFQQNKLIVAHDEKVEFDRHAQRHRAAIRLDFDMKNSDLAHLNALYAPHVILPGTGTATSHPLAAAHQRVAYHRAYKIGMEILKAGQPLIEVGPNPAGMTTLLGQPGYVHGCCKPDGRDQTRYMTALTGKRVTNCRDPDYKRSISQLINSTTTHRFCAQGFGQCDFQSTRAVAIHSLYDITFSEIASAFNRHGLDRLDAWMHFPVELLATPSFVNSEQNYRFDTLEVPQSNTTKASIWKLAAEAIKHPFTPLNYNETDDTITTSSGNTETTFFSFLNDASFGYQHNTANWKQWMTCGGFHTPYGFSISIERVQHNGSQYELRITRQTISQRAHFFLPSFMSDLVGVPDFTFLARRGFCKHSDSHGEYIWTSAQRVNDIFQYAMAREFNDRSFNLETVVAYARSKTNALTQQSGNSSKLISSRWNIQLPELNKVCTAIYLLASWERMIQRRVTTAAFEHMAELDKKKSFYSKAGSHMRHWLQDALHLKLCKHNAVHTCFHGNAVDECFNTTRNWFHRVNLKFQEDQMHTSQTPDCGTLMEYKYVDAPIVPESDLPIEIIAESKAIPTPIATNGLPLDWAKKIGISADRTTISEEALAIWNRTANHCDLQTSLLIQSTVESQYQKAAENALNVLNARGREYRKFHHENMVILEGVPGAGKTTFICNKVLPLIHRQNATALFVAPSRALKEEIKIKFERTGVQVHTIHTAMKMAAINHYDYVFIDECHTHATAIINWFAADSKVILVGDKNQIDFIDFSLHYPDNVLLAEFNLPTQFFNVTHRCPIDICMTPLFKRLYPGITTRNKKDKSIVYVSAKIYDKPGAKHLTFLQEDKANIINNNTYTNVSTIGETQGCTYPTVILHYGGTLAEKALLSKEKHLVVALSRHTDTLYICDATGSDIYGAINDDNRIAIPADISGVNVSALVTDTREPVCDALETLPDTRPYPTSNVNIIAVEETLNKICPMPIRPDHYSVITNTLPAAPGADVTLRLHELGKDEQREIKKHSEYVFPHVAQRVKITKNSNQLMACKSVLTRLGKMTKNLQSSSAQLLADKLFAAVTQEFDFTVNNDIKDAIFVDACKKFTEKGHDLSEIKGITSWNDQNVNIVKNFLKAQQKPCFTKDPILTDKAGQGISAWSKTLNFQLTIYTRLLEHILTRQSRGRVILSTGMSDQQVLALLEQTFQPGDKTFSNDWSEFDSSQNNVGRELLRRALAQIGCPDELLIPFIAQLSKRTIVDTFATICAYDKKDSGAPHTLVDNCLFNMAVILDCLSDFRILMIKGDDSCAFGTNITFKADRASWYTKNCGYQFKPDERSSGEFVSFIVNQNGASYDLPRLAAKAVSRVYTSRDDYNNFRTAIGVTLRHNPLTAGMNMLNVNAFHYGVSNADADNLLSFLHRFARGDYPFSSLTKRESQQVIVDVHTETQRQNRAPTDHPSAFRTIPQLAPIRYAVKQCVKAMAPIVG
jgi:predicted ATPase